MLSQICCFTTDLCKCQILGLTRNKNVKLGYIALTILTFLVLLLVNSLVQDPSEHQIADYGCQQAYDKVQCIRDKNGQIFFAGLATLHLILLFCMFCKTEKIKVINQGIWIIKIIIIGIAALFWWLIADTVVFTYLTYFSDWGTNILYFFEAIVFVDLVYALNNYIDECTQENNKIYIVKAILAVTLLIAAAFTCFISFQYNAIYICWINAVLLVLFVIIALLRIFKSNSILVAAFVSLCINFIGFYIQNGNADHLAQSTNKFLWVSKGIFALFLLLGMLCQGSNKLRTRKSTLNQLLALNTTKTQEDNRYVSSNKWTVYHYVITIITLTLPPILFWQNQTYEERVSQQWMLVGNLVWWGSTIILYLWSLIVEKIFPQKDFSDLQNYFREYELS